MEIKKEMNNDNLKDNVVLKAIFSNDYILEDFINSFYEFISSHPDLSEFEKDIDKEE